MTANRLMAKIRAARREKRKLFCAFLTLGYPNVEATEKLIEGFAARGVDLVELGFPFSDPLADGPTIQFSSEEALKKGVKMEDAFRLVKELRKQGVKVPIIFFSYLNPIHHFGIKQFVPDAVRAGFDGLIVPDLPPEEEPELQKQCRKYGFPQIFFISPTTLKKRARMISHRSKGFIYYVSLRGVTGARKAMADDLKACVSRVRRSAKAPVLIGFGVSGPEQARALAKFSDGVIVGSAIVDSLKNSEGDLDRTIHFVSQMIKAIR